MPDDGVYAKTSLVCNADITLSITSDICIRPTIEPDNHQGPWCAHLSSKHSLFMKMTSRQGNEKFKHDSFFDTYILSSEIKGLLTKVLSGILSRQQLFSLQVVVFFGIAVFPYRLNCFIFTTALLIIFNVSYRSCNSYDPSGCGKFITTQIYLMNHREVYL